MNGLVNGGWAFVWAAYGITAIFLGGCAVRAVMSVLEHAHRRP